LQRKLNRAIAHQNYVNTPRRDWMLDYLIYNCEIVKCIPGDARFDEFEYCEGWSDYKGMGISVVATASSSGELKAFVWELESDRQKFLEQVAQAKEIVGFNSRSFDDCLMAANNVIISTTYDLLEQVRLAAGFGADYLSAPKGYRYSLQYLSLANDLSKTGSGALAPQFWQQGKRQEVIDYCLNDVRITQILLERGLKGELVDPNTYKLLELAAIG
jgi:hypothetical protein